MVKSRFTGSAGTNPLVQDLGVETTLRQIGISGMNGEGEGAGQEYLPESKLSMIARIARIAKSDN